MREAAQHKAEQGKHECQKRSKEMREAEQDRLRVLAVLKAKERHRGR